MIVLANRWETAGRYYELYAGEDLFGQTILVKVWGGKGSGRGGSRTLAGTPASLEWVRQSIATLRKRHGYIEVPRA